MIDIAFIRENPNIIKKASADKLMPVDFDRLLELDVYLREVTAKAETWAIVKKYDFIFAPGVLQYSSNSLHNLRTT